MQAMKPICFCLLIISCLFSTAELSAAAKLIKVPVHQEKVDGAKIPPGAVVLLEAGKRTTLSLENIRGTEKKPIVVVNHGGLVRVANDKRGYAIAIRGCQHLRLTGTGDKNISYGIQAEATRKGMMAVHIIAKSTHIEVDHVEVTGAGFAGFNVKDEPREDGSTNRGAYVMEHIHLHHNYIHDVKGEGFYVGHTFYHGHKIKGKTYYPHVLKNIRIAHNRIENTGCEGIQVGSCIDGLEVTDNTIIKPGIKPFAQWQDNGIQINAAGSVLIARNVIIGPPGNGIIGGPLEDKYHARIERNVVINPGGMIAYVGGHKHGKGGTVEIIHNTFVGGSKGGYKVSNKNFAKIIAVNNLMVAVPGNQWELNAAEVIKHGNLSFDSIDKAGFADTKELVKTGFAHLHKRSPARGKGIPVTSLKVGADRDGMNNGSSKQPDVGAAANFGKADSSSKKRSKKKK